MKILIAGAGIGGLTAALCLNRDGFHVEILEAVPEIKPLGVGINLLPHGSGVLHRLGLGTTLDRIGIRTRAIEYRTKFGQVITSDLRGIEAGFEFPQYSLHRGLLQMELLKKVVERLGPDSIQTGMEVKKFIQDDRSVIVFAKNTVTGDQTDPIHGDILIGADGFHSQIRKQLHPNELPAKYEGMTMWRGISQLAPFGDGETMFIAGNHDIKLVCYPISSIPDSSGNVSINWVAEYRQEYPREVEAADWTQPGNNQFVKHFNNFHMRDIDVLAMLKSGRQIFEYPMVDRDPLPSWGTGRVNLLGDAAHPMYPVGANGASQAILDCELLSSLMTKENPVDSLKEYEEIRRTKTSEIVLENRRWGPEKVLDIADDRVSGPEDRVEDLVANWEVDEIARDYRNIAGFKKRNEF